MKLTILKNQHINSFFLFTYRNQARNEIIVKNNKKFHLIDYMTPLLSIKLGSYHGLFLSTICFDTKYCPFDKKLIINGTLKSEQCFPEVTVVLKCYIMFQYFQISCV